MSRDENEAKRLSGLRREIQPELVKLERRLFLRSGLSLGALSLLSGCDLSTGANGTVIDSGALGDVAGPTTESRPGCSIRTPSHRPIRRA